MYILFIRDNTYVNVTDIRYIYSIISNVNFKL